MMKYKGQIEKAKPFLKWAGGKTQLLSSIEQSLPQELYKEKFTYIEPFVGSGAVLFWILNKFQNIERVIINDINSDLINVYKCISLNPEELISILATFENEFHQLDNDDSKKKDYYYQKRDLYNTRSSVSVFQAALFIFLNRTCFNGLYRVNKSNLFNVPIGSYRKPTICDKENILAVSNVLRRVQIFCMDFENTLQHVNGNAFFYLDPPYKPLDKTSSFNSYTTDEFNDDEQIRLGEFCKKLDILGYKWMLSNSDLKGKNSEDHFFDLLYKDYNITRVKAKRTINANPIKRGELNELLITNYQYEPTLSIA